MAEFRPLHERVPREMHHHSSGRLLAEKFPTFASGPQGRGPVSLSGLYPQFPRARPRDVAGGRINGIRGWVCATSSLGSPVMIVQVRSHSPDSGSFHPSQSPAKINGRPFFHSDRERQLRSSCFLPFIKSVCWNQAAAFVKAWRNDGALSTVSARALIVR
jgi:hypothetical protein